MKLFLYAFLMNGVFNRYRTIKSKEKARLKRFNEAKTYLNEWQDIPITQLYPSICEILKIKENNASRGFIYEMCFGVTSDEELIKKLSLIW